MDSSDSDSDIPLAKITHGRKANPIPICNRKRPTLAKLAIGGNLFRKNSNRKNGESYFNPFKEAIVDSLDHLVTLEKGHILAGKMKSSPPKNSTRANPQKKTTSGNLTGGNPTRTQTITKSLTEVIVIPDFPQKSSDDSSLPGPSSFGSTLEPIVLDTPEERHPVATQPRSTFRPPALLCWSPSDFLIPLPNSGDVQTSRKSPTEKSPIIVAEQDSGSEISSTIDQDVQQEIEKFDANTFKTH